MSKKAPALLAAFFEVLSVKKYRSNGFLEKPPESLEILTATEGRTAEGWLLRSKSDDPFFPQANKVRLADSSWETLRFPNPSADIKKVF